MTTIAILPAPTEKGISYQGTAGDKRSLAAEQSELDALLQRKPEDDKRVNVAEKNEGVNALAGERGR